MALHRKNQELISITLNSNLPDEENYNDKRGESAARKRNQTSVKRRNDLTRQKRANKSVKSHSEEK